MILHCIGYRLESRLIEAAGDGYVAVASKVDSPDQKSADAFPQVLFFIEPVDLAPLEVPT